MSTDTEWERWGAVEPYYGVLTNPKFRSSAITEAARQEFFESGRRHVDALFDSCGRLLGRPFEPSHALDFGCGVGRIAIPLSERVPSVVAMDVSPSMLAEAKANCERLNAKSVELVLSDDDLSNAPGSFDFVHSSIVLQHIELARGRALFAKLVERVGPGGVGSLHVTFGLTHYADMFGQIPPPPPPPPPPPLHRRLRHWLGEQLRPKVQSHQAREQPPSGDPEMQMNYYNLSELYFVLQRAGVQRTMTELTDHGGALGAFIFFQKPPE